MSRHHEATRGSTVGVFLRVAAALLLCAVVARADDFDTLISCWAKYLTGGTNLNTSDPNISSRITSVVNTANDWWSSMDTSGGRTYLWSDLASAASESQISAGYDRLADMALAWAMTGSSLKGNTSLAADIVSGLDWMYANRYNETVTQFGNWWYWVIGTPYPLNNAMVLMYPRLSGTQITNYCKAIDKFVPSVIRDSANRVWECRSIGVRGAVGRNAAKVAAARDGLTAVFPYVTSGNGFYTDGSYLFHGAYPYTGGYGNSLLIDLARLMDWLAPTAYAVTDSQRTNVIQWLYDSYEPLIYAGAIAEHVRGREIARSYATGNGAGQAEMNAIFRVAQTAPANDALRLKGMVKYWDQVDTTASLVSYADIDLVAAAGVLLTNSVPARCELIGHYQFPSMDRVMHLRPGFGFTLSLFSSRIYNYESINGENLHGWFTGYGMGYLLTTNDITQFTDSYWPTVDPYHLPGTTVVVTPLANSVNQAKMSTQPWVGGAVLSNSVGAAGMSLDDVNSTLVAKKSWFMFDNEVVCLGAGITCSSATNVHTTVENRSLHTTNTRLLNVGGKVMLTTLGWSSNLNNVTWCALDGSGGYYFPGGANLKASRVARSGSWADIGLGSGTSITRNFVSLILDHGVAPANATYAYVLLPNYSSNAVSAYAANPQITVLANTSEIQAARETTQGVIAANFWAGGGGSVDFITCNRQAAVITRETNGLLDVAISDPTWTNSSTITLTLNRSAFSLISADAGIAVLQLSPQVHISVAVSGARGQSFQAKFSLTETNGGNSPASGAWLVDGSGDWSNPANWTGGIIATGADMTATFAIDSTSSRYVNNDPPRTLGSLICGDANTNSAGAWFITNQPITLQVSSGTPTISVSDVAATIRSVLSGTQGLAVQGNGALTLAGTNLCSGNLAKSGSGRLILSGPNTFGSGTLTFGSAATACGYIQLANDTALGNYTTINVAGTGAGTCGIEVDAGVTCAYNITTAGRSSDTTTGYVLRSISGNNTWNGNITVTGTGGAYGILCDAGTLTVGGTINNNMNAATTRYYDFAGAGNIAVNGVIADSTTATPTPTGVTCQGPGSMTLGAANTYSGPTAVWCGTLSVSSINSVSGGTTTSSLGHPTTAANATITIGNTTSTGTLRYTSTGETSDRVIKLGGSTGGAALDQSGAGLLKFTSDLSAPGATSTDERKTLTLTGSTAGTGEIAGKIVDSTAGTPGRLATSVTKAGTGTWTLSGANTYSGATAVNAGTLLVSGVISGSAVTVSSGSTLGGTGLIHGPVVISSGATLAPGASLGALTISNVLALSTGSTVLAEINAQTLTNDLVRGLSNVVYAGTLSVTNIAGTLAGGQSYRLFTAMSFSGNFSSLSPASPGSNLSWSFSPTNGTLNIVAAPPPRIDSLNATAGSFTLSGTGPTGQSYRILATTNLALPLANWTTVGLGVFTGGALGYTDSQMTNASRRFYRVATP